MSIIKYLSMSFHWGAIIIITNASEAMAFANCCCITLKATTLTKVKYDSHNMMGENLQISTAGHMRYQIKHNSSCNMQI